MSDDVEVVRAIYEAMAAKDIGAIFERLDPSIVVRQDERLPWGGTWEGHDGFATFGMTLAGEITSAVTIDAIFEADGWVVQTGRTKGRTVRTGTEFDMAEVHRWRLVDVKEVEAHMAIDTPAMLRALAGDR